MFRWLKILEKIMEVEVPLSGRSRSFTGFCMSRGMGLTMTMRVTACAINMEIPSAILEVTPQVGTEITTVEPAKIPRREI